MTGLTLGGRVLSRRDRSSVDQALPCLGGRVRSHRRSNPVRTIEKNKAPLGGGDTGLGFGLGTGSIWYHDRGLFTFERKSGIVSI